MVRSPSTAQRQAISLRAQPFARRSSTIAHQRHYFKPILQPVKHVVMSFGFSVSDLVQLVQLAFRTVQNSRKACGEHDELTHETSSLHTVLRRLQQEASKPECPINRHGDSYREELATLTSGCGRVLNAMDKVLEKYNALGDQEKSIRKLWQKVRFGNGQMVDIGDLRSKISYYTSALSLFLNMLSVGSIGRVEKQMDEAGGELREIRLAMHSITAHLMNAADKEGSVLTAYADDDKAVWREFRRELIHDGFSSSIIRRHKNTIQDYVKELGSRGFFDETDPEPPDEDSEETDEVSEGIIWDPENDPASIVSGSKTDASSGVSSARTRLKLSQSDIRSLSEVPQRTKLAQLCQHSLERPDIRSEHEPSADERAGASQHEPSESLRNDSDINGQGLSRNGQVKSTGMRQNLQDEILQEDEHTIKATKDTSQTQECYQLNTDPKDGFLSSGLALTLENLRALQRQQFAIFCRSELLNRPGVDESFHTDFLQSFYTAGEVNIALLLEMFEYRVEIIETTYSGEGKMFERVACYNQNCHDIDFSKGPATLVNHVDSCIFLMYRMCTFSSGKRVRFLDSRVESVLQDFSRRQRQVWKRESSVTLDEEDARILSARSNVCEEFLQETIRGHDSVSCRALLVGIVMWIMTFDTASLDYVDRPWLKVRGPFDWTD